jgi:hypothetical protein
MPSNYTGHTVFVAGTGSIQSYVFATNRLKDNAGASELARQAMSHWKDHPGNGKLIFAGGGNAAVLFPPGDGWKDLVYLWSREWLKKAPGLRLVTAAAEVQDGETLGKTIRRAQKELRAREGSAPFGALPTALPVVRTCSASGAPASVLKRNEDNDVDSLSTTVCCKRKAVRDANKRLQDLYRPAGDYEFPLEFDDLRTVEGESQIAIVHIDGNGIGKLFIAELEKTLEDDELIASYKALSDKVSTLTQSTFRRLVEYLVSILPALENERIIQAPNKNGSIHLPLRPLVEAGDDLTFVCHGRLGLHLAVKYLEFFQENATEALAGYGKDTWTACAGVMIQPQKFPFARGYRHAEALTGNAKKARRDFEEGSWVDFQAIYEGAQSSLQDTRRMLYGSREGELLHRPYVLGRSPFAGKSWDDFLKSWRKVTGPKAPRSRAKELRSLARQGDDAVRAAEPLWELAGAEIADLRGLMRHQRGDYWDALEMMDIHWEPKPAAEPQEGGSNVQTAN